MAERSYIHTPTSYRYHYQTVPERLKLQAKLLGEKEVYVFLDPNGGRIGLTVRELYEKSKLFAKSLITLGIRKGDVIALCLNNDVYGILSLFGVILSGAIVLNICSIKEDGSDLINVLSKTNAKALVINPGYRNDILKACMNFLDEFEGDGYVKSDALPSLQYFLTTTAVDNHMTLTLEDVLNSKETDADFPKADAEDIVILFPTSGSTGESKFVPQSHFAAMIIGHQLYESIQYEPDDIIYTERRFAWIGGFPFMLLHNGVKVVTKTEPIPNMQEHIKFILNALIKERCTHACLLPASLIGLNDLVFKTSGCTLQLKGIHTGGLPVASACASGVGQYTRRVTSCYGSSEAGFITSYHVNETESFSDYNTGKALQGVEVKVIDPDGIVVRRGQMGEIRVRSPSLMSEYYKDKEKTDQVLDTSRWFNTDDVGFINENGELVVTGRHSDIILQGGKVFVPSAVEGTIKTHPAVLDVIVVPVPDELYFQLVCACIIAIPGTKLSADDVKGFYTSKQVANVNEAFSGYVPRMFLLFNEYPRLYTGKPDKKRLILEAIKRKD